MDGGNVATGSSGLNSISATDVQRICPVPILLPRRLGLFWLSALGVGVHDRIEAHDVGLHAVVEHRFRGAARSGGPWRRAVAVGPNCCAVCACARKVHS